jgi:dTDP-glucose pyrophosphorylase/predicted transcriptional regulator
MQSVKDILVTPDTLLLQAMQRIERGKAQIVLVVDSNDRLIGAVTDGDVRRAILRGVGLDAPVSSVMNANPTTVTQGTTRDAAIALMKSRALHQLPVLDSERRVVDLITLDEALRTEREDTIVVLMAGGLGSRLRPLTEATPKPLLPIGGRPLLEITISNLARQGFGRFFVSINYKADMFRDHFAQGQHLGVDIDYLQEDEAEKLGTAGALRLLPERPKAPVLVMNGDILTNIDARRLVQFHRDEGVAATMCVRSYEWRVPYGVVQMADGRLVSLEEKPTRAEFVNAGIYVLSPEALDHLPADGAVDMPALFANVMQNIGRPAVYVLQDYWLDIGHIEDLQRARDDIHLFK